MNITTFKIGDEIVRTQPAQSLGMMISLTGESIDRGGDRSYMGDKLIFAGIANGQIYCKRTKEFDLEMLGEDVNVSLDIWSEGWEKWIDPTKLTSNIFTKKSKESIEEEIQRAVDNEDYELAEKLRLERGY